MATCVVCHKPLTLYIEPAEEDDERQAVEGFASANTGSYVDDDVQLQCEQQLLCNLNNEGGFQERIDMLPILTEEGYLKAYPEERKCRAFLEFCGEGDVEAIADLLNDNDDGEQDDESSGQGTNQSIDVLRYQDQLRSMGSGLHVAIQNQRMEVAWLLLLLASTLEMDQFPAEVLQAAQNLGIQREDQSGKADIRSLRDSDGMTAEQRATGIGGIWTEWLQLGRLKPPAC